MNSKSLVKITSKEMEDKFQMLNGMQSKMPMTKNNLQQILLGSQEQVVYQNQQTLKFKPKPAKLVVIVTLTEYAQLIHIPLLQFGKPSQVVTFKDATCTQPGLRLGILITNKNYQWTNVLKLAKMMI